MKCPTLLPAMNQTGQPVSALRKSESDSHPYLQISLLRCADMPRELVVGSWTQAPFEGTTTAARNRSHASLSPSSEPFPGEHTGARMERPHRTQGTNRNRSTWPNTILYNGQSLIRACLRRACPLPIKPHCTEFGCSSTRVPLGVIASECMLNGSLWS